MFHQGWTAAREHQYTETSGSPGNSGSRDFEGQNELSKTAPPSSSETPTCEPLLLVKEFPSTKEGTSRFVNNENSPDQLHLWDLSIIRETSGMQKNMGLYIKTTKGRATFPQQAEQDFAQPYNYGSLKTVADC